MTHFYVEHNNFWPSSTIFKSSFIYANYKEVTLYKAGTHLLLKSLYSIPFWNFSKAELYFTTLLPKCICKKAVKQTANYLL